MAQAMERQGGCLCGAVRLTAVPKRDEAEACHCSKCRRWTGGAFMSVLCDDLAFSKGEGDVSSFRSSDYGERLFCARCGSTIAFRMLDGSMVAVALGVFDDGEGLGLSTEIFFDEKPTTYAFANETKKLTGAEVFAQFAKDQGA